MARHATATKVRDESIATPSRDAFAAMLDASFETQSPQEGAVITGTVVAVENDFAMIDVGLKTEGRVSLKEFSMPGMPVTVKVGDKVEVYLERVENALGEAVLSRDKARREESWIKLEKAFNDQTRVAGVIFGRVRGGFTVDLAGAVAISSCHAAPCWKSAAPRSAPRWSPRCRKSRSSKAWSRTSPTTAPSWTWAAWTACSTSPTSPGAASLTRPKSCRWVRPSPCRSSRSTTKPSASAWA